MRGSFASLVSQTANGVVDLIEANIPENVMQAFELEERPASGSPPTAKESQTPDAPWGTGLWHQICPHSRVTHPRMHLLAIAGLLVAGALVVYMTALHMGYLSSEEAALLSTFNQTLPYLNNSRSAPPPMYMSNSSLDANSATSSAPSALDYTNVNITGEFSQVANVSIPAASPQSDNRGRAPAPPPTVKSPKSDSRGRAPTETPQSDGRGRAPTPPPTVETPQSGSRGRAPSPPPKAETIATRIYYQNMSETWHTMSDKKLLLKATSMPPLSQVPRVAKLAYMFIARGPLPFAPLWERYFRGHEQLYSIYIHAHPNYVPTFAPTSPFFRRFVPNKVVVWGKLSVYEAERRLLGNALLDLTNEWFLLLSESCVPVFSFPETYTYFNHSQGVSFIESYADSSRRGQGRLYRGNYEAMAPEITGRNFRKGSQWFQITRDLALLAARDSKEYTKFEKHFCQIHSTCYIDEHFLPTFAWIKRPRTIAFRTLTYYAFRGKSPHPKKFAKGDTNDKLIVGFRENHQCTYNGQTTSKCYLFVRKFDPDALSALLNLAGPVMGIP